MLKWIHNKNIPKYFLTAAGLVIVMFFALNSYPLGHWMGQQFLTFPGGAQLSGLVFAAFVGLCVFIMFFHKEYLKIATKNHSDNEKDTSFFNAFQCFVFFVLGLEICSVAFRWIELNGSKLGWVILGLGLAGIGLSLVLGKILHAMMNLSPVLAARQLREEAGRQAWKDSEDHLKYLTTEQKMQIAAGDSSPVANVRDERAIAREREVAAVEDRRRQAEDQKKIDQDLYDNMLKPSNKDKVSSNGHKPF